MLYGILVHGVLNNGASRVAMLGIVMMDLCRYLIVGYLDP